MRVPIGGETRTFVAVHERPSRRTLLVNPRGPHVEPREVDALLEAAAIALKILRPRWVVGSGSTPPGCPHDLFAQLGMLARGSGSRFIADTDGEAMQARRFGAKE